MKKRIRIYKESVIEVECEEMKVLSVVQGFG
jgi:hypothetical protein